MTTPIKVYVIDYGRKYLQLQWIDPTTGKRCSRSSKKTKRREASIVAAELEKALNAAIPAGDGRLPFADFVLLYDEGHLSSLAKASRYRSMSVLSMFRELIAPETIGHVSTAAILRFVGKLRASGSPNKTAGRGNGVSETTIKGYIATLRAALSWAKEAGHLAEVPKMPRIARATKARAKGRPLTDAEFLAMLRAVRFSAVTGFSDSSIPATVYSCGYRSLACVAPPPQAAEVSDHSLVFVPCRRFYRRPDRMQPRSRAFCAAFAAKMQVSCGESFGSLYGI